MTRLKMFLLVALIAAGVFAPSYRAAGPDGGGAKSNELDVEISRAGADASYVPALGDGPGRYTVIRATESAAADASGARVYGVKVAPRLEGGAVRVSLSILSGKFDEVTDCERIKALREEVASTRLVRKGESVRIAEFERLGVPPFELKVVGASGDKNNGQTGCCRCQGRPDCCVPAGQDCKRCSPHCICCVA